MRKQTQLIIDSHTKSNARVVMKKLRKMFSAVHVVYSPEELLEYLSPDCVNCVVGRDLSKQLAIDFPGRYSRNINGDNIDIVSYYDIPSDDNIDYLSQQSRDNLITAVHQWLSGLMYIPLWIPASSQPPKYLAVTSPRHLDIFHDSQELVVDIETTSKATLSQYALNPDSIASRIICIGLYAVDTGALAVVGQSALERNDIVDALKPLLTEKALICHNASFEYRWLSRKLGITPNIYHDTMLLASTLRIGGYNTCKSDDYKLLRGSRGTNFESFDTAAADSLSESYGLKQLARAIFGVRDWSVNDIDNIDKLSQEDCMDYCSKDVYYTGLLYGFLINAIPPDSRLRGLYRYLVRLVYVLGDMMLNGLAVDANNLQEHINRLQNSSQLASDELEGLGVPRDILLSWDRFEEFINETYTLPPSNTIADGDFSQKIHIVWERLLAAKDIYPEAEDIVRLHKQYIDDTYALVKLDEMWKAYENCGKLVTTLNINGASSGRLSSTHPNLQNLSKFSKQFIIPSSPEKSLVEYDFSQLELRVAAYLSNDTQLIDKLTSGQDIHRQVASLYFQKPPEDITDDERRLAKGIVFGLLYARSAESIYYDKSINQHFSLEEVKRFQEEFFNNFPMLRDWIAKQRAQIASTGKAITHFARERVFPVFAFSSAAYLRQGFNTLVQSVASDINMLYLLAIRRTGYLHGKISLLLTVHDSVLLECNDSDVDDVCSNLSAILSTPLKNIPGRYPVEFKVGKNYADMTPWVEKS